MKFLRALLLVCLGVCRPALADNFLVLPFFNLSNDDTLEWIGESLAEALRETLAAEGAIVLSREDREEAYHRLSLRMQTQLTKATVIRLAELLDAHQVIYGTFDFAPPSQGTAKIQGTLRITAEVINLRKARSEPEFQEIGALEDLAKLQTHLSWQTLQAVMPKSASTEEEFRNGRPAVPVEAIENYTRGLLATTTEQRLKLFSQAVRLDPAFSAAGFQLGKLQWERRSYRIASDLLERIDPKDIRYREAHFFAGLARYRLGEFADAERDFRIVAEAVPLNEVWNNLAAAQARLDSPEALANFEKALEGDPGDPVYHFNVGYALFRAGEMEKAADRFRAVLDRNPDDTEATTMLGRCLKAAAQPRSGTLKSEGLERLKQNFEESAYLQLKAVLESRK
jgi:tetratricopeptide (TPR) repeat protein